MILRLTRGHRGSYISKSPKPAARLAPGDRSRVIEMAWEDRTPFEAIRAAYGLSEQQVMRLMQRELKPGSYRLWRKRVQGRASKHVGLRGRVETRRAYSSGQYKPKHGRG